jgi:hypothetical protein
MQYPPVDLLPFGDSRYRFYQFPINYVGPLEQHAAAHRRLAPFWRYVPHETLRQQIHEAPRFMRNLDMMLAEFDAMFYLAMNPDVVAIGGNDREFARHHYAGWGFDERRLPFLLNEVWYAKQYPMAAFEVSQGDYSDFAHHYIAVGRARGYRPVPDA